MSENLINESDDQFDNVVELLWSSEPNSNYNMYALLEKLTIKKYGHAKGLHRLSEKPKEIQNNKSEQIDTNTEDLLNLFEEDLKCVICSDITVSYRNQLMECDKCHLMYHQNCHNPNVVEINVNVPWTCQKCLRPTTPSKSYFTNDNISSCDGESDEINNITKFLQKVNPSSSSNNVKKRFTKRVVKRVSKSINHFESKPDLSENSQNIFPVSLRHKENLPEKNIVRPSTSKNEQPTKSQPKKEQATQSTSKILFPNGPTINIGNAEKRLYYMKKRATESNRLRR